MTGRVLTLVREGNCTLYTKPWEYCKQGWALHVTSRKKVSAMKTTQWCSKGTVVSYSRVANCLLERMREDSEAWIGHQ